MPFKHSKRWLSSFLAVCTLFSTMPTLAPSAEALEREITNIDISTQTIASNMHEHGEGNGINMVIEPDKATGRVTILMKSRDQSGNVGGQYQYNKSNSFASVTAVAEESGTGDSPEDPTYWKNPTIDFTKLQNNENWTNHGTIQNVKNGTVSSTSTAPLFEPNSIVRMFTEDNINNETGKRGSDTKVDVVGIVGKAPGQENLELTLRVKLIKNGTTGKVNMGRYILEAKNLSQDKAYVYGWSWNVDTFIGSNDKAPFKGPGLKPFSTNQVAMEFPNSGEAPWSNYLFDANLYKNSIPKYLYAMEDKNNANSFTATIYPKPFGSDVDYPGVKFQEPNYFAMDGYGNITSTTPEAYYYYKTYTGVGSSEDSGHIVRYNPRVILPGQSLVFGVDYGQGSSNTTPDNTAYLNVDMWADELAANVEKTGYDEEITPNIVFGNTSQTNYTNAKIEMKLDKRHLTLDDSMKATDGWTLKETTDNNETWVLDVGALNANTFDKSITKPVVLKGIPQFSNTQTSVTFKLVTTPEINEADKQQYLTKTKTTTLEKCSSLTLGGVVWRDVNGNGKMESFEGRRDIPVKLYDAQKTEIGSAVSTADGGVVGPTGVEPEVLQFVGLGDLVDENQRYTPGDITVKVGELDYTEKAKTGITTASNDDIFEELRFDQVAGKKALAYKVKASKPANLHYSFELKDKSVLEIRPFAPGNSNLSATYTDATKVEAGTYDLVVNGEQVGTAVEIQGGQVPLHQDVIAKSNAAVTYHTPLGYRHVDGNYAKTLTQNNVTAWYPNSTTIKMDFPLYKGDIRLSGLEQIADSNVKVVAVDQDKAVSNVVNIPAASWKGKQAQLSVRAWDDKGAETATPTRTDYNWQIVEDAQNTIQSLDVNTGAIVLTGKLGTAKVKVSSKAMPNMFHEMTFTVSAEEKGEYNALKFVKQKADTDALTHVYVPAGGFADVYIKATPTAGGDDVLISKYSAYMSFPETLTTDFFTVKPAPAPKDGTDDEFLWRIEGKKQGFSPVTPTYGDGAGKVSGTPANVLVTALPIDGNTKLVAKPDPIEGKPGASVPVTYWLKFGGNGMHDHAIDPRAVDASIASGVTTVATLSGAKDSVTINALGTDSLKMSLFAKPDLKGTATIRGTTVPTGSKDISLTLKETTNQKKHGFIEKGQVANYTAFAGDTPFGYDEITWKSKNGNVTIAKNADNQQADVTANKTGVDQLIAELTKDGETYTATVDIVVHSEGTTFKEVQLDPPAAVMPVGEIRSFNTKVVYETADKSKTEAYILPESMYDAITALPANPTQKDSTIATLVEESTKRVQGVKPGQALYSVTVHGTQWTGNAKLLVLPAGAGLKVKSPIWVAKDGTENVAYTLTGTDLNLSSDDLLPYITARVLDTSIATFGANKGVLSGKKIGRTTLEAELTTMSATKQTAKVYVFDGTNTANQPALKFIPETMDLLAGGTGTAKVALMNGTDVAGYVDLEDLTIMQRPDEAVARIPETVRGDSLPVTATNTPTSGKTQLEVAIPGNEDKKATLPINVTGSAIMQVTGLEVSPKVIELWPGVSRDITVKDTGTDTPLNGVMLTMATKAFEEQDQNVAEVVGNRIVLKQTETATKGINKFTITVDGHNAEVYIVNFTQDPYDGNHTLTLDATPDPVQVEDKGQGQDTVVTLTLVGGNGAPVDDIALPAHLVKAVANTRPELPGRVKVEASQTQGKTLTVSSDTDDATTPGKAGLTQYRFTYQADGGKPVSGNAMAFVFAKNKTDVQSLAFVPAEVEPFVGQSVGIKAEINYNDGTKQPITSREFPYVVKELKMATNPDNASIAPSGVIKGLKVSTTPSTATGQLLDDASKTATVQITVKERPVVVTTYTVAYDPNGGTGDKMVDANSPYAENSEVSVLENTFDAPAGKEFDKWNTQPDGTGTEYKANDTFTITENTTLYAQWKDKKIFYLLTYSANHGTVIPIVETKSYEKSTEVTIRGNDGPNGVGVPAIPGKVFDKWTSEPTGGKEYPIGSELVMNENLTLYAQWKDPTPEPTRYALILKPNGAKGYMESQVAPVNTEVTVPVSTFIAPEGKEFASWNTQEDGQGTTYHAGDKLTLTQSVRLYAQWQPATPVSPTDPDDSGSGGSTGGEDPGKDPSDGGSTGGDKPGDKPSEKPDEKPGEGGSKPSDKPSEGGNPSGGGSTGGGSTSGGSTGGGSSSGGGAGGFAGGSTGGASTTQKYTLKYVSNGGTTYENETYPSGKTVKLDKVPTRTGYIFTGWFAEETFKNKITEVVMKADKTVYAGWKAQEVTELYIPSKLNGDTHKAYVAGYQDGTFRPEASVTRAEVAMLFYRLLKDDVRKANESTVSGFSDVQKGAWYNTAVSTIAKLGIIKGRSATEFAPNAPIQRDEFAAICARFDQNSKIENIAFTDIAGLWAEKEIQKAATRGWVRGYEDGSFRPTKTITRAEVISMINRVLGRLPESKGDLLAGMKVWPDVSTDAWYYLAVQEASNSHEFVRKADGVHERWTRLVK